MKTDFAIALAILIWFGFALMLWLYLRGKLDEQIELGIECVNERWHDVPVIVYEDRPREKQNRPRNASHGRPRGRMSHA